jgi:hypothetical protein
VPGNAVALENANAGTFSAADAAVAADQEVNRVLLMDGQPAAVEVCLVPKAASHRSLAGVLHLRRPSAVG